MADHAARAAGIISPIGALSSIESIPERRVAVAQVHATLALVEQQRIANLIAYASHRNEHKSSIGGYDYPPALMHVLADIDFQIRESLNVEHTGAQ